MRKIDRLFEIVQLLRGRRLRTAGFIADELGVSVRTVYRDIQGLMASGVPIEGERGIGYMIRQPIEMPPLHLTELELKAVQLGIEMVVASSDPEIAKAAQEARIKIRETLPFRRSEQESPIAYVYFKSNEKARDSLADIRIAIEEQRKLSLHYSNEKKQKSHRIIRPLGLEYWGQVWTVTAWCELRDGFRVFRVDRIEEHSLMDETFTIEKGKSYQDYLEQLEFRS
ncbi:helix-turn-helix transcriptional regulator [Kiloniella sp. b19]|uniref:helix-turn-helix transcriptional regulator n=1 Tax=Kiloniella sp. GXU_MW_B19 TaxID=3141326 RepID=UPI0031D96E2C